MKHIKHEDRKSFTKFGLDHPYFIKAPVTTKAHRAACIPGPKSIPAIGQSRQYAYGRHSIMTDPGQSVDVLDLRDGRGNPLYRRSRDGGVRRMEVKTKPVKVKDESGMVSRDLLKRAAIDKQ